MFARPGELTSGCVCFGIVIYRLFMVSRRDEAHNRPFDGGGFQCARLKLSRPPNVPAASDSRRRRSGRGLSPA